MKRGRLVAFEGLDGSGKSTQLQRCADALEAAGHDVVRTHEPTDGPIGRRIREMARSGDLVAPETELAWFVEDRAAHVAEVIEPALAAGRIVLTDRYTLSSVAYQGGRGLDWREILAESERRFPRPDLALVFELPAEQGLERVRARGGQAEPAFERLDFLQTVAQIFAALPCDYVRRIDAAGSLEAVEAQVRRCLEALVGAAR